MSAISSMFEATLGPETELEGEHELIRSSGNCGTLFPRWWVVDVGVRSRLLDTSAQTVPQLGASEFQGSACSTRAPLHLRVDAGILDGRSGSQQSWLVDAASTRAYLFASSITVSVVGPRSLTAYATGGARSQSHPRDLFVQFSAGIWAADPSGQSPGVPKSAATPASCSLRVFVPANSTDVRVAVPPGARSLVIYDSSRSSSPWTWTAEGGALEAGRVELVDGQSAQTQVPSFSHLAPAEPFRDDRELVLVFGVEL